MSKERECLVCAKHYQYCPHCNKNNIKETWKNTYCSKECREIFNTCSNFEGKLISQEEAYNKLSELDINSKNVTNSVRGSVERIMSYKPKTIRKTEEVKEVSEVEEQPKRKPRRRRIRKVEE